MKLASALILCAFLLLTNRWLSYDDGIRLLEANDTHSSMLIAQAAPALPHESMPFHHAQRIAVSYTIGLVAKAVPLSYHVWFTIATLLCFAAIVGVYLRILQYLGTEVVPQFVLLSLLLFNPYSFRYYFAVPGLVYDLVFVLGLSLALLGLLERHFPKVFVGLLVASLARQTGLLILPAVSLWIFLGSGWKERSVGFRALAIASLLACSLSIYFVTGQLAARFAAQSTNLEHLTRIFHPDHGIGAGGLAEIGLRAVIPMAFPLCILLGVYTGARRKPALTLEFWACLILSLFITLQPFLGGGTNITRLSALGLIPWLTALGMTLRETHALDRPHPVALALLQSLIVLGSFHHMYTYIGGDTALAFRFSMIYFASAAVAGCLAYFTGQSALAVSARSG